MILIVTNKTDESSNDVMDWLHYLGHEVRRINAEDIFVDSQYLKFSLCDDEDVLDIGSNKQDVIQFQKAKSIWFRRDSYKHLRLNYKAGLKNNGNVDFMNDVFPGLFKEYITAKEGAFTLFRDKAAKVIGNFKNASVNKIEVLHLAKKYGLNIPKTLITNNKKELTEFYAHCNSNIITKAIRDGLELNVEIENSVQHFWQYTELITDLILASCPDSFFPSLFQEKIEKSYEIRTFFLDGKCYSMAIFSQLDAETDVDFRRYNVQRGNRNVPYQLPDNIEKKIIKLMDDLELNTGSIDLIKPKEGDEYVFLEVNPVGQYGMTSVPCNYNLDKVIAKTLANGN